jgi:hypothetical protein
VAARVAAWAEAAEEVGVAEVAVADVGWVEAEDAIEKPMNLARPPATR